MELHLLSFSDLPSSIIAESFLAEGVFEQTEVVPPSSFQLSWGTVQRVASDRTIPINLFSYGNVTTIPIVVHVIDAADYPTMARNRIILGADFPELYLKSIEGNRQRDIVKENQLKLT